MMDKDKIRKYQSICMTIFLANIAVFLGSIYFYDGVKNAKLLVISSATLKL